MSEPAENIATAVLEQADALSYKVCFHCWRTNRVWTRDSGCIFRSPPPAAATHGCSRCISSSTAGAKYPNYQFDEKIGGRMAKAAGARGHDRFRRSFQ